MGKKIEEPPPLEESDTMAMNFYAEYATEFTRDFGLMPGFIERLGLAGGFRRVFLAKLNLIHDTVLKMRAREIEKMRQ
jgi:hypothetical protein